MLIDTPCPCGQTRPYGECCGPLHRGDRAATTAEELMRSRYAAFCRGEVDYLIRTWHPDQRSGLSRRSLEETCKGTRWQGLRILDVVPGGPTDDTGVVEFEARYEGGVLHERSRFVREMGLWYYVDGTTTERAAARAQGRNELCACGSRKKFKRCCGAG